MVPFGSSTFSTDWTRLVHQRWLQTWLLANVASSEISVNVMVEGWPRRALSPGPQSSSLLASSWKSIGLSHSYAMSWFLPAAAATRVRHSRWSAGGHNSGRGGLYLGLPLLHGLRRGAILERPSMCSVVPSRIPLIRLALSFKGRSGAPPPRHDKGPLLPNFAHKRLSTFEIGSSLSTRHVQFAGFVPGPW